MRLVGWSMGRGGFGTLDSGFLAVDSLSLLVGANDVGKSQVLRHLASSLALQNDAAQKSLRTWYASHEVALFAEAETEEEADLLVWLAVADLRWRTAGEPDRPLDPSVAIEDSGLELPVGSFPPTVPRAGLGVWREGVLDAVPITEGAGDRDLWARILRATLPQPTDAWIVILDALRRSRIFAFTPAPASRLHDSGSSGDSGIDWAIFWCLPPLEELDEPLERAIREAGLAHVTESETDGNRMFAFREAPTVIAPVGAARCPLLPSAIAVPGEFERIAGEVEKEIDNVADALFLLGPPGLELGDWGSDDDPWVIPEGDGARPHPSVVRACEVLSATATKALPPSISDRYRVEVCLKPLYEWGRRRTELVLVDGPASSKGRFVPIDQVADGHVLWIQLALLEAVDELRRFRQRQLAYLSALEPEELPDPFGPPPGEDHEEARVYWANLAAFWKEDVLIGLSQWAALTLPPSPAEEREVAPGIIAPFFEDFLRVARHRLYVIDEPERHLHPRAQREAARWLASLIREGHSQVVAASHSVPFLALAGGVVLNHVWRAPGGVTHIDEIPEGELSALSVVATDLGLDRGELLAAFELFLFVEGDVDRAVLEELKGVDLRRAGVCVVPLRSESRAPGVLDAHLLRRFTDAKVAVWLDNVDPAFVERLQTDYDFALTVKEQGRSVEERRLADLVLEGRRRNEHGRDIVLAPHPGQDIFDLLADDAIQKLFSKWPGHDAARRAADAKNRRWKAHYAAAYGLQVSERTCREIARTMVELGLEVPALDELVEVCAAAVLRQP